MSRFSGKRLGNSSLTDLEVIGIRERIGREESTVNQEADRYMVSPDTIKKIVNFRTYRHVVMPGHGRQAPEEVPVLPIGRQPTEAEVARSIAEVQARLNAPQTEGERLLDEMVEKGKEERIRAAKWAKEQAALGQLVQPPPENERVGNPMEDGNG